VIPAWVTGNWALKVLAIAIAFALWVSVVGSERRQMTTTAPVEYVGLANDLVLVGDPRERMDVQLEVTRWAAPRVTSGEVRVRVTLASLPEGETIVPVTPADVEAPPGVRVTRITPSWVRVSLTRALEQALPVVPRIRGVPASGFAVSRVAAEPSSVQVKGPRTTIEQRDGVETVPVDVSGIRASLTQTVGLLLPEFVTATRTQAVQVTVEIQPEERMQSRGGPR
jgi:hypothetical protein